MNAKFQGMLGLAMRAGKLAVGEGKAEDTIRSGNALLVVLSTDASDNTEKKFLNMADSHDVNVIRPCGRDTLGQILGREFAVVMAVTDSGFARQLELLSL